jgi:hypothetical protein
MLVRSLLAIFLSLLPLLPSCANEPRYVDIAFSVGADGSLRWTKYLRHGGSMADDDALAAIAASAPFMPLPPGSDSHAEFLVKFIYHCTGPARFSITRVGTDETLETPPDPPLHPHAYRAF